MKWKIPVRYGDGTMRVGDEFTRVTRFKYRKYPEEFGDPAVLEWEAPISLRITGFIAYDKHLQSFGQGITGMLEVEGEEHVWEVVPYSPNIQSRLNLGNAVDPCLVLLH